MEFLRQPNRWLKHVVAAPFIYMLILPIAILDVFIEVYHHVCFPLYGLPLVDRHRYITFDRQKLSYLKAAQKLNCMFCSYANGLIHYVAVIGGETERYWCGIQHAKDPNFVPPEHHKDFLPYGDEKAFKEFIGRK